MEQNTFNTTSRSAFRQEVLAKVIDHDREFVIPAITDALSYVQYQLNEEIYWDTFNGVASIIEELCKVYRHALAHHFRFSRPANFHSPAQAELVHGVQIRGEHLYRGNAPYICTDPEKYHPHMVTSLKVIEYRRTRKGKTHMYCGKQRMFPRTYAELDPNHFPILSRIFK